MDIQMMDHKQVLELLPDRLSNSHKGDYGKLLMLCGSRGYTGAATLAAMGALRTGAGLVFLSVPESIYAIEAIKLTEPVIHSLPDDSGTFAVSATAQVLSMLERKDAVLVGPGIGQSQGSYTIVRTVLEAYPGPVVLDADGINVLAQHIDILRERTAPTIITPHVGEFQRIGGNLTKDRITAATNLAKELGVIVLLKGHNTIITDGINCYQNPTGNPGMATGGSGDVLAGIITALLGFGLKPLDAAACGAWLHGAAGDICAKEIGQYGMLPSDMLHVLPRLLK